MTFEEFKTRASEYIQNAKALAEKEHACGDYTAQFLEQSDCYIAEVCYRGRKMFLIKHHLQSARFTVERLFSEEVKYEHGSRVTHRKSKVFDFIPEPRRRARLAPAV